MCFNGPMSSVCGFCAFEGVVESARLKCSTRLKTEHFNFHCNKIKQIFAWNVIKDGTVFKQFG